VIHHRKTPGSKLPPVKRVALFHGQRPLNKGSTKVLMFSFAPRAKHGVSKANNDFYIQDLVSKLNSDGRRW
jgi:hypothetical protein